MSRVGVGRVSRLEVGFQQRCIAADIGADHRHVTGLQVPVGVEQIAQQLPKYFNLPVNSV